ncbi:hypothetical protein [Bartonella sp. LJL80]
MPKNRLKVVGYIADMSRQMNKMALNAQMPFLAFLLEMVVNEGQDMLKSTRPNRDNR